MRPSTSGAQTMLCELLCYGVILGITCVIVLFRIFERPPVSWQCRGGARDGEDPDGHGHCPAWADPERHPCGCECHEKLD